MMYNPFQKHKDYLEKMRSVDLILFDIDGTLADASHRVQHLRKEKKDWKAFYTGIIDDEPIVPMVKLYQQYRAAGNIMLIATGRNYADAEPETTQWLAKHNIVYDGLYFRQNGDKRPDYEVKEDMMFDIVSKFGRIPLIAFEDSPGVIKRYRELGIFTVNVMQISEDFPALEIQSRTR